MIVVLLVFWFFLSGQVSHFFILSALISALIVFFVDKKLFHKSPLIIGIKWKWIVFVARLLKEIFISAIDVTKIIWLNPNDISPKSYWVKSKFKNPITNIAYANSITLTPGTMSMDIKDGKILVHSLTNSATVDQIENIVMDLDK